MKSNLIFSSIQETIFGQVIIAFNNQKICWVRFGQIEDLNKKLQEVFPDRLIITDNQEIHLLANQIATEFINKNNQNTKYDNIIFLNGTNFQQKIWEKIAKIPSGQTTTYEELAISVGCPKAVRAVGTACRRNPVSILIPCHRVLHKDGTIGNYAYGKEMKKQLLDREKNG